MIVFKFKKDELAAFISHLDTARAIRRAIARAKIKVEKSQGFNPHPLIFFGAPLPLGIPSESEYCTVITECKANKFVQSFNKFAPGGISALKAFDVSKNPNLAHIIKATEYEIEFKDIETYSHKINDFLSQEKFMFKHKTKKFIKDKNLLPYILKLEVGKGKINCILKSGNENLRADLLMKALIETLDIKNKKFEVKKLNAYTIKENNLIKMDEFLSNYN